MDDVTPEREAMVNLDSAELVVPLDAVEPEPKSPVTDTTAVIDPTEFFDFFSDFNDWPTNGLQMAESAEHQGYSHRLVQFFEGLPGTFCAEADVMPYAEDPSMPPFGQALAADVNIDDGTEDFDELTINEITDDQRA